MKKVFLAIFGILVSSCGLKAYADSSCGNPKKGKFTCDTDQISLEYTEKEIKQNNWYNTNAGSGALVFGPYLDIEAGVGKFKEKSVHASIPVYADGGRGTYPCTAANSEVGKLLYTFELTASDKFGRKVILDSKNVYRTWSGYVGFGNSGFFPAGCIYGVSIYDEDLDTIPYAYGTPRWDEFEWKILEGKKYVNLSSSRVPASYTNFQIVLKNVSPDVRRSQTDVSPISTLEFNYSTYRLVDLPIFLNINGFR